MRRQEQQVLVLSGLSTVSSLSIHITAHKLIQLVKMGENIYGVEQKRAMQHLDLQDCEGDPSIFLLYGH